jgi:hypothetical protein
MLKFLPFFARLQIPSLHSENSISPCGDMPEQRNLVRPCPSPQGEGASTPRSVPQGEGMVKDPRQGRMRASLWIAKRRNPHAEGMLAQPALLRMPTSNRILAK